MFDVLGCRITQAQLTHWQKLLVCAPAPYFFSDDLTLPPETFVLSRKAFSECGFNSSHRDSYTTYAVAPPGKWVALLTPTEFDALPTKTQQHLLTEQCQLGRGQVYRWEQVEHLLQPCIEAAKSRSVTMNGERYFLLDSKIWQLLGDDARHHWLIAFITQDNPPTCLSATLTNQDWSWIASPIIQNLAGTFALESGANYFSTTLAAITHNTETATTIANFWLHQEPFFDGLARRGYVLQSSEIDFSKELRDVVLVWQDGNGRAQHACYLIGNRLVLNKNAQTWFSPRQMLTLRTVLDEWADEGFSVVAYGRNRSFIGGADCDGIVEKSII